MSHQIQQNKNNSSYDYEENEIDLLEIFKNVINYIFDNLKLIAITTIVTAMIFFTVGRVLNKSSRVINANIKISQSVIDSGRFPNGEAFNKNILIDSASLKKFYVDYKFDEEFKDYDKFIDSIIVKEVPLDNKLSEKGFKSQEYQVNFSCSNVDKGEEFLKSLIGKTIKENKEKQKEIIVETKVEDILLFDYIDRANYLENYILEISSRIDKIKNSSITSDEKKALKKVEEQLYRLRSETVYNYSSYLLQNKLTNNLEAFKVNSSNRIYKLEDDMKKIQDRILVLKDVINVYKIQTSKDSTGSIILDKYYSELINEYKDLNNQLLIARVKLDLYRKYVSVVKVPSAKEEEKLNKDLTEIMRELNGIKLVVDKVSDSYYDKLYSDLIILSENIESKSKVKPVVFLIAGIILGFLLGIFIAFIRKVREK